MLCLLSVSMKVITRGDVTIGALCLYVGRSNYSIY